MIDTAHNSVHSAVVVESSDALLATKHFALTICGLKVIGAPTLDDYCHFAYGLGRIGGMISLGIGDLLNSAEIQYGETYAQVAAALGWDDDKIPQLQNFKWVSSRVPFEWRVAFSAINERHAAPSFTLCKHAASIQDDDRRNNLIARAAKYDWNSEQVKAEVDKLNGKRGPTLTDFISRALAPLRSAAEAYPSARAELNKIIQRLERML